MTHQILMIAATSAVTVLLRFLPFWIFGGEAKTPHSIAYLGKVLPCALMGMLVVYCLKNVSFAAAPYAAPKLIAAALTAGLYLWRRNTLISIVGGTVCYMLLVQFIF